MCTAQHSTSHAGGHRSITFDLTPPLFYYERAKYVYSTELPQELYNRGDLPFSVQPIFHATFGTVHNGRSSS